METLGEFLQQVRQQRGITLEEVASQTKISLRMLRALEANDFSQIPSELFAWGFARSYAQCLGLNEGDIFKKYRESASDYYAKIPVSEVHRPVQGPGRQRWIHKLIVGAAMSIVVALVAVAFYAQSPLSPISPVQDSVLTPAVVSRDDEATVGRRVDQLMTFPAELTVNVPGLPEPPDLQERFASGGGDLTLVIEALERSWVVAHIDGKLVKEVLLQPGEKIHWKAKTKFVLTLGNAGGVRLEFNGKTLDALGPRGKVVKNIILTK